MKANVSLDMELVGYWANKIDEFRTRKPDIMNDYALKHADQPLQFYCDLFTTAVMQYHKTKNMVTPEELQRFVAHGALISYAASRILANTPPDSQ